MRSIKEMPIVTVEQTARFREKAVQIENERDDLVVALSVSQSMLESCRKLSCACGPGEQCGVCMQIENNKVLLERFGSSQ